MPEQFLLDTNAYALIFQTPRTIQYDNLKNKIKLDTGMFFYISEITSLEIHSVLGKFRRGVQEQKQRCRRNIILENGSIEICPKTWIQEGKKRLKRKVYHDTLKLLLDIELKWGNIQASKIPLTGDAITIGTNLLMKYSDKYSFGSHDALIAGSLIDYNRHQAVEPLIMVTSDKGLKAVFKAEAIPVYDPYIN